MFSLAVIIVIVDVSLLWTLRRIANTLCFFDSKLQIEILINTDINDLIFFN